MNHLQRLHDAVLVATFVCLLAAFVQTRALLNEPHGPLRVQISTERVIAGLKWQLEEMAKSEDAILFQYAY